MKIPRKMDTKRKILYASAEEFAEKGYNGTTIRAICKRAKANVAAVNYHFDSKESLYKHMFNFLFNEIPDVNPLAREWDGTDEMWKEMLGEWLAMRLKDITGEDKLARYKSRIFCREMLDASDIFPDIYRAIFVPRIKGLEAFIRKVVPPATPSDEIYVIIFSAISSFFFYFQNVNAINVFFEGRSFALENMEMIKKTIVENVWNFVELRRKRYAAS